MGRTGGLSAVQARNLSGDGPVLLLAEVDTVVLLPGRPLLERSHLSTLFLYSTVLYIHTYSYRQRGLLVGTNGFLLPSLSPDLLSPRFLVLLPQIRPRISFCFSFLFPSFADTTKTTTMDHNDKASSDHDDVLPKHAEEAVTGYVPGTEEEKKLVRKIDLFLLPAIWGMYLLSYMVRTIMGNAEIAGSTLSLTSVFSVICC